MLFQQTLLLLHQLGWARHRVDTYVHPDETWTIRHHYTHGEWEWYYEPDKYWNPHDSTGKMIRVRLTHPPLPTAPALVCQLLGIERKDLEARLRSRETVTQQ